MHPKMGFLCPKCGHFIQGNDSNLLWHLKNTHQLINGREFVESVTCKQDGCQRTYSGRVASFRKHLKKHDIHAHVEHIPAIQELENLHDDDNDQDDGQHGELHAPEGMDMWDNFGKEEVEERAAVLVSGLLASSSVVNSTVTHVIEQTASLVADICSFMKHKTGNIAAAVGIPEHNEHFQGLLRDIDCVSQPFANLQTEYKQKKFFQSNKAFVQPEELPLGVGYFPSNNTRTGNVQQVMKTITFQYIPIKPVLELILKQTDLLKIASCYSPSTDDLLRDFHDGSYCRSNPILSLPNVIKLIIYIDDFEVSNPLSPKAGTHKLGAVYFSIANVPPKYRSVLRNMFLLMFFNASDTKMYGYGPVFTQFIQDINQLVADGIDVDTETFRGNVKVTIAQVVGDNLGVHSLFGFAEGFTANYPCRICKMHRNDARQVTIEKTDMLRTVENYEEDVSMQNLVETGIKSACPLNNVTSFHVITSRAPDVMHDLLEGVCPLELKLVLNELINKGYFNLDTLNARMTSFNYGFQEKRNKPCPFTKTALRSPDGAAGQNAGQMWCLVRHIALMLGDLVPENDQHWELLLTLLDCLDIIFSPVISRGDTLYLQELIRDHHTLFLQLFPLRHLKPKHHHMLHYPSAMREVGPLIHLWVMRFEAFHNFSKRLAHIVCNFQNIAKTLAYRNQMLLCYHIMSRQTLVDKPIEIGPGELVIVSSLEGYELIAQALNVPLYGDIYLAKWCKVYGTEYRPHLMVALSKTEFGEPVFAKIRHMIAVDSNVYIVGKKWYTIGYDRHRHAFMVQPKEHRDDVIQNVQALLDYMPLHANQSYNKDDPKYFICLRHNLG